MPPVRGFRLGMSLDEVRARFRQLEAQPPSEVRYDSAYGYLEAHLYAAEILTLYPQYKDDFKGIQSVRMNFLDGRMTYLAVEYDNTARWPDVDAILPGLTSSLGLPAPSAWQVEKSLPEFGKQLDCHGFKVVVRVMSRAQILFHDTAAPEVLSQRMRDKAERQRREFKP